MKSGQAIGLSNSSRAPCGCCACSPNDRANVWSADELLERVWPGVLVTQSSVYQAIAQLRRVLGDDGEEARYIATVPRRGYRLVAEVELPGVAAATSPATSALAPAAGAEPPRRRATDGVRRYGRTALLAGVLIAAVAGGWILWPRQAPASVPPAVAVLPFADLSDNGKYQPFCDGLSDELLNALARVPACGSRAAIRASGSAVPAPTCARWADSSASRTSSKAPCAIAANACASWRSSSTPATASRSGPIPSTGRAATHWRCSRRSRARWSRRSSCSSRRRRWRESTVRPRCR